MVVEDEEGSGVMSGCQTWWWLRRGAGRYLESLPVGPNHSNSVLTPGLFLQSPQLPASLFGGVGGKRQRARTNEAREGERRRRRRGDIVFFFCLRSANIAHTHTHTAHQPSVNIMRLLKYSSTAPDSRKQIWHTEGHFNIYQGSFCNGNRLEAFLVEGEESRSRKSGSRGHLNGSKQFHLKKKKKRQTVLRCRE